MCIRITERYAVCKCVYYQHGVDACPSKNRAGHDIQEKTVLVGYACAAHSPNRARTAEVGGYGVLPDSTYGSGSS